MTPNPKYKPLIDAMQEFVDRCDKGEIRSKYTYAKFKEVLRGVEEPASRNIPTSKELISLAEHDWHNREERKHKHPMLPWVSGWITGFLSERKPNWGKEREEKVRKEVFESLEPALQELVYGRYSIKDFAEAFAKEKFKMGMKV